MMDQRRVFVVGDSLFADSLSNMLSGNGIQVVGIAPTLRAALPLLESAPPEVVIVAEPVEIDELTVAALRGSSLEVPFIFTNLERGYMELITSQRICARSSDLLDVIATLPKR